MNLQINYKSLRPRRTVMRIFVCSDSTHKTIQSIANYSQSPFSNRVGCLSAARLDFTRVKLNTG